MGRFENEDVLDLTEEEEEVTTGGGSFVGGTTVLANYGTRKVVALGVSVNIKNQAQIQGVQNPQRIKVISGGELCSLANWTAKRKSGILYRDTIFEVEGPKRKCRVQVQWR